jgi:hypothetical protein
MSRSGYSDDLDNWDMIKWRGQVASAIRGKRGQAFLRELLAALDAMPEKRLVQGEFEADGEVCALGSVARVRGMDLAKFDPDDAEDVGDAFGIANQLALEIMWENDEFSTWDESTQKFDRSPEKRWEHMRKWVANQIRSTASAPEERK